jgi:CRISPR-associated endoribonuclease Cas6
MELLSLVLPLKPLPAQSETPAPLWWGRAAHALLLDVVKSRNESLANELHQSQIQNPQSQIQNPQSQIQNPQSQIQNQIRPFTVSTLMGRYDKGALIPDQTYLLRLTAFRPDVAEALEAESTDGALRSGQVIELDYRKFQIQNPQIPNPQSQIPNPQSAWESRTSYTQLSAPLLLSKEETPRRLSFQLTSPTTFKSGGKHFPVPTPALVFGSLLDRWNAFAPLAFPDEVKRYAEECLAISKYDLKTKPIPQKDAGLRVGAIGRVTFTSVSYDRYWMSVLATLAEFALFCGLGAGTAQGLGQARRIED